MSHPGGGQATRRQGANRSHDAGYGTVIRKHFCIIENIYLYVLELGDQFRIG